MNKTIKINCPCCDEEVIIKLDMLDEKVLSVLTDNIFFISDEDILEYMNKNGIEFG